MRLERSLTSLEGSEVNLTDADREALYGVWLGNDVNRGLEWLFPTVESIVARHVATAKAEALRKAAADMINGASNPELWDHAAIFLCMRADRIYVGS